MNIPTLEQVAQEVVESPTLEVIERRLGLALGDAEVFYSHIILNMYLPFHLEE